VHGGPPDCHPDAVTSTERSASLRGELTAREKDAVAFQAVVVLGSIPDLLVALVRFARQDRGIQLGPTATTLAVAASAPRFGRWAFRTGGRRGVAARLGLVTAVLVLPAAAGGLRSTVVGTRNPLWQLGLSAAVRVVSGCLTVLPAALAAAKRRRAAQLTGA
jgi:hypothetical protein